METDILHIPSNADLHNSAMARFAALHGFPPQDHNALHNWSITEKNAFWQAVWDFTHIIGEQGDNAYIPAPDGSITNAQFFPAAQLNFTENLLANAENDESVAVHAMDEQGKYHQFTQTQLKTMVAQCANGLKTYGIHPGDRVAGIQTNAIEGLVALLATAAIGAVWTSCSPDFGAASILERLKQASPKVLFATPRYFYGGQAHDISERLKEIANHIPELNALVLCGEGESKMIPVNVPCQPFSKFGNEKTPLEFVRVPFSHPLYILYTSGTTGIPKAIVHSTGGVLLEHRKEHILHCDLRKDDTVFWYTNTAWMMYHWLISALASGAAIVLYDGSPILKTETSLDHSVLWRMCETLGITHFGTSPKYVSAMVAADYHPNAAHNLTQLRWVMSSGAPMPAHFFDWLYQHIKQDMIYASVSGGTEIIGCFLLGSPVQPVRRGQLTCKSLGLAVGVMDETNTLVIGKQGELVCTDPFPSMPLTFLGNQGNARYHETYFSARPNVWSHGDLAEITKHGSAIIYGRSDTTLNPGGVRVGTAEIYAACENLPNVQDCIAFSIPAADDEEVVLCLQLAENSPLTEDLARAVRARIREQTSPRHVPHRIYKVTGIPYTLNGKRVEKAARLSFLRETIANESSLINPDCLLGYRKLQDSKWL
ncbi:MAG: acetoacetate--CoA ligase [Alphaproteobacteria bacterium]